MRVASYFLKSPSISEIFKPLDAIAEEKIQEHSLAEAAYGQQLLWLDAKKNALDELKKAAKKPGQHIPIPEVPVAPQLKRYKTEDGIVEKIGEILSHNPQGILIHRDELTGWFRGLDKYGHEGDRAFYLESWNGNGAYTIDRIGRGTLHIKALCLSIIGGIQPGPLKEYVHQAISGGSGDDGLLQRFQLLVCPDPIRSWKNVDRLPDRNAKEQAYRIFQKLDTFAPFAPYEEGTFKTYAIHFSAEAQQLFDNWRHQLECKIRDDSLAPALESHLAKYRSLMPKLALNFCMNDADACFPPKEVDAKAASRAIRWWKYLESHARRLYAAAEAPGMEAARALLERIKAGDLKDGFTVRSVYHARHWSKLDTMEKVTNGIKILEEFGWVRSETPKSIGRPSLIVRVHPYLTSKEVQNPQD